MDSATYTALDVDKLISAVKARPPLYSRNERYAPKLRQKKTKLWREVCRELNPAFDDMSGTDKLEYEREVFKRWRSLRTCFSREIAMQKSERLKTHFAKRRKRYEHFDALRFLLPEYEDDFQDTIHIIQFESEDESAEVADFEEPEEPSRSDDEIIKEIKSETEMEDYPRSEIIFDPDPVQNEPESGRDTLENVSRRQIKEESDSDKLFILSLVPSFRRINPKRKLAAKIELMKVLQSFQED